jgi:hypothetical protein
MVIVPSFGSREITRRNQVKEPARRDFGIPYVVSGYWIPEASKEFQEIAPT